METMRSLRDRVPDEHPVSRTFSKTDVKRTRADLSSIFNFGQNSLERDDVKVTDGPKGAATVKPNGRLDEREFETFTEKAKSSDKLGWDPMAKQNFARGAKLDTNPPLEVHGSRDDETIQNDIQRKARVTTDPEKYAESPSRYDYPFVDTPSGFKDEFGDESFPMRKFEQMAGEDDVFEW
jgi:hypothetical protein